MKKLFNKIKNQINLHRLKKWVFLVDIAALLIIGTIWQERDTIFHILAVAVLGWNVWQFYRVYMSRHKALVDLKNYRVMCASGEVGLGKTSYLLFLLSLLRKHHKSECFTNIPIKVHGEFTSALSREALGMRTRLPEGSATLMDEMSLYYNNMNEMNGKTDEAKELKQHIKGFEAYLQLIRHNFDGHFLATSVNMGRILAVLEEKVGQENRMLEQKTVPNALLFPLIFNFIRRLQKKKPVYFGIRCWTIQKFRKIQKDGYTYDLSTDNANMKTNKFTNLVRVYTWNDGTFEYDDRFARKLYQVLKEEPLRKFKNLHFSHKDLKGTGFDSLINIYARKYNEDLFDICEETGKLIPKPLLEEIPEAVPDPIPKTT